MATRDSLLEAFPETDTIMIGRGILRNPGLLQELRHTPYAASRQREEPALPHGPAGALASCAIQDSTATVSVPALATLKAFHAELLERYRQIMPGDTPTLYKMKELWAYLSHSFESPDKYLKKIRKADHLADYLGAVNGLFGNCRFLG